MFPMNPVNKVIAKVLDNCFQGRFTDVPLHVVQGRTILDNTIPDGASDKFETTKGTFR